MGRFLRYLVALFGAVVVKLLSLTVRVVIHRDPRPELRRVKRPYIYAFLHAHQVASLMTAERGTAAMVSRSRDGHLLVPSLRAFGVVAVRGSSRRRGVDKGGHAALQTLIDHAKSGLPTYLAVDGPTGPRNAVRRGVSELAHATGAAILPAVAVPSRRWILSRTWDRMQVPKPFSTIDVYFAAPHVASPREEPEELRRRVEDTLNALEAELDGSEAKFRGRRHPSE